MLTSPHHTRTIYHHHHTITNHTPSSLVHPPPSPHPSYPPSSPPRRPSCPSVLLARSSCYIEQSRSSCTNSPCPKVYGPPLFFFIFFRRASFWSSHTNSQCPKVRGPPLFFIFIFLQGVLLVLSYKFA